MLYEGTGLNGSSELRDVEPTNGLVRRRMALPDSVFGEGITIVGDRIWQLTFRDGFAFERDRATLGELRRVEYRGEGWGVCHDRTRGVLVMSDGTPTLTLRDARTFAPLAAVPVTLDGAPLRSINELECVRGQVWANVWLTDQIVLIDPGTGVVDAVVDAAGLLSDAEREGADVLNGIAAVPCTDTFLVTGKLWPRTFLVRFAERQAIALPDEPAVQRLVRDELNRADGQRPSPVPTSGALRTGQLGMDQKAHLVEQAIVDQRADQ
jgi:glutaminyl-peptide cyclotransferase